MEFKAVEKIAARLETVLTGQGYIRVKTEEERPEAVFIGGAAAYIVSFEDRRILLKTCTVIEGEPDNQWKKLSVWGFDPQVDDFSQVESISNDFFDTVGGSVRKAEIAAAKRKKSKSDDDDSATPIFFINRCLNIIPELKEELRVHKEAYGDVVPVYFCRTHVAPKIIEIYSEPAYLNRTAKLSELLSQMYKTGDMDVRSIISQVILSGIEDPHTVNTVREQLSPELQKAWQFGEKYKGKVVKPEKQKKNSLMKMAANSNPGTLNGNQ